MAYVFEFIFEDILRIPFSFTTRIEKLLSHQGIRLNYSEQTIDSAINLKPHDILFEQGVNYQNLDPVVYENDNYFFASSEDSFLPFDPFACSFYVLTRYEEYLERDLEKHRRYPARHSILKRKGLLTTPIINKWAYLIADKITRVHSEFKAHPPTFNFLTSIDIDNAWAFKNKSSFRTFGACGKAIIKGDFKHIKERVQVIKGKAQDPYDTYSFITESYTGIEDKLCFFMLVGKPGKYDRNISPTNTNFRKLIKDLAAKFAIGIHPSYSSVNNEGRLKQEINTLEEILNNRIDSSRQHFLKLEFPTTYRRLIDAEISHDYTLGYAEDIGFRAGTAHPFFFYDLQNDEKTNLLIHPLQLMDVSMKDYLNLSPEESWERMKKIMYEIKKYGGTFISLWHNESLNDIGKWKGWKTIFTQMTNLAIKLSNEK